jgi:hypothetical protein
MFRRSDVADCHFGGVAEALQIVDLGHNEVMDKTLLSQLKLRDEPFG